MKVLYNKQQDKNKKTKTKAKPKPYSLIFAKRKTGHV